MGWGTLLREVFGMAGGWLRGQQERQTARLQADIAIETRRATADIDWDTVQAQNSGNSWKDEWFTLLLSIPMILIFIPSMREDVAAGFTALQTEVPDWYLLYFGVAVSAAFGYRQIVQPLMDRMSGRNR